ncbi:methylated-DNA--[protein]-cysteine S-methyltransferase [Sellimonas caecigallum]|uniref:Methylated-DNA--protein-cysteine methyltransferase n=1 Tax=Sellimonas caecigallum TaxID=2592333 RepID=A0ABS7L8M3_9FIRM|nr:methylated-DNA--[protein]-cysteine S-methyltransferase [Sellimonas caecigallum]MBY0759155.1 methylated-DNA--[protein]-cysteine S-methyltransferase [Sellimonas caecigallum]OUP66547.1 6-O-methylguanine DNA methyltransferase [Drancourtella sp. An177]
MIYMSKWESPIGGITMAGTREELTGLWFDGQKYFESGLPKEREEKETPVFQETKRWLSIYFQGKEPDFTPPLLLEGSEFRKAVWRILLTIPYGETMSYGEIARRIAKEQGQTRMSAQAVGGAVGHNPISIIVPCHRVVGTNGSLTGYAGGIDRKIRLLTLEKTDMSGLFVPKKGTAL